MKPGKGKGRPKRGQKKVSGRTRADQERAEQAQAHEERAALASNARPPTRRPAPAARPTLPTRLRLEAVDGRASALVVGSVEFCRFVRARLLRHRQARVAGVANTRQQAIYSAQRNRPDVVIVDADPQWLASTFGLVTNLASFCLGAAMVIVPPEGVPAPRLLLAALQTSRWSLVVRRRTDDGRRLREAISSSLIGVPWVDPLVDPAANSAAD